MPFELPGLGLEDADKLLAYPRSLLFGVVDAVEPCQEPLLGVDVDQRNVKVAAKRLDDLRGFFLSQQAVIDEHTRQLVANRFVHQ